MRLASVLLLASIVHCSLCGCGAQQSGRPVLNLPDCPAPPVPELPCLDAAEPLETPRNLERLMERDDRMRAYIAGLTAALSCWEKNGEDHHGTQ